MAKEILDKIREIETQAEKIIEDARLEAARMENSTKEKAVSLKERSVEKQEENRSDTIRQARIEAEKEIKAIKENLILSIKGTEKRAKPNIKKAKDLVVKEMKKRLCL